MHGNREQVPVGAKLSNASDKFNETLVPIVDNNLHCYKRVQGSFSWCISALLISITLPVSHSHVPMGLHSQQPAPRCVCPKEAGNICEFFHSLLSQYLWVPWILHQGWDCSKVSRAPLGGWAQVISYGASFHMSSLLGPFSSWPNFFLPSLLFPGPS